MKPRLSEVVRFLSALFLAVWAVAPRATAQPQPILGLRFSGGQPTLSLTGTVGTVYSIQYATNLSPTSQWTDRTLLKAQAGSNVWSDPTTPTPGQRFYRAVSVPTPADTNLVFIQPGTFTMGSPTNEVGREVWPAAETQHTVTLTRGFWMGKYEVTQGEYLAVMGNNPSHYQPPNFTEDLTRPVEFVNWFDATAYCTTLTEQERAAGRIPTNCVYRLPTEAEWEYGCRGGTSTRFSYGDDPGYTNLSNYAWYWNNSNNQTHPVGGKLANPWGLYDMHGNVWEWCQDWFGAYADGIALDPQGPAAGTYRVGRGGGWDASGVVCRSACRHEFNPAAGVSINGFRVVLALGQP